MCVLAPVLGQLQGAVVIPAPSASGSRSLAPLTVAKGQQRPGFESRFCHSPSELPWGSFLTYLGLCLLIGKHGGALTLSCWGVVVWLNIACS